MTNSQAVKFIDYCMTSRPGDALRLRQAALRRGAAGADGALQVRHRGAAQVQRGGRRRRDLGGQGGAFARADQLAVRVRAQVRAQVVN